MNNLLQTTSVAQYNYIEINDQLYIDSIQTTHDVPFFSFVILFPIMILFFYLVFRRK